MGSKSPRMIALELLIRINDNAYSNLVLDGVLSETDYDRQEKNFISRIVYGVTERRITLDYIISLYSNKPLHKLDKAVLVITRMGLYQIMYMDSVPDSAAVNESVKLVKQSGKASAAGFVNAILRNYIRNAKTFSYPENDMERLSVMYSAAFELTKKLVNQYGVETAERFLADSLEPHKLYIRTNPGKITSEELVKRLSDEGVRAKISEFDKNCIETDSLGAIEENKLFEEGCFHVQDLSSQFCCKALDPKKGERILDICAAPGGKSFTIAEMTEDDCELYSCDLHKKRVELIRKGAERLGLESIKPLQNDAKIFSEAFPLFDKILCDVPCSGTGVIRSKPEIKYSDFKAAENLPAVQYKILETAAEYLKIGGELVYSTCTVLKDENDYVIDRFLSENKNFEGVGFLTELGEPFGSYKATIFPEYFNCEGFFISKIVRCA